MYVIGITLVFRGCLAEPVPGGVLRQQLDLVGHHAGLVGQHGAADVFAETLVRRVVVGVIVTSAVICIRRFFCWRWICSF